MNITPDFSSSKALLSYIIGAPYDSDTFLIMLGAFVFGVFVFGKIFCSLISDQPRKGIFCGMGLLFPVVAVFIGYELFDYYAPSVMGNSPWIDHAVLLASFLVGLIAVLLVSPMLTGIGVFRTFLVFMLTGIFTLGLLYMTTYGIEFYQNGKFNYEEASSAFHKDIKKILN